MSENRQTTPTSPTSPTSPTAPPSSEDRTRAGATWVTGTGALLLLAAAGVFVAVQWDHISDEVKLGVLALLTGGFLVAGRHLRERLPATAGVLYHLGAFLIPINVAAIGLAPAHRLTWEWLVLVEGAVATGAWLLLDRTARSKVLAWAIRGSVIVTAAGAGAVLGVPAGLVLSCVAAGTALSLALGGDRERRATDAATWAAVAGLAPALAVAERALPLGTGVLRTLGLSASTPGIAAAATGVTSALVLARVARRRESLVLVVLAGLSLATGVATAWVHLDATPATHVAGLAALFVTIEVAAHLLGRDPFWSRPAQVLADVAEGLALAALPVVGAVAAWIVTVAAYDGTGPVWQAGLLAAGALAATGWFLADLRRLEDPRRPATRAAGTATRAAGTGWTLLFGTGWSLATVGIAASVVAGVAAGTASPLAAAIAAIVIAGLAVLSGRDAAHGVAATLVLAAPVGTWTSVTGSTPTTIAATAAVAAAGAAILVWVATIRSSMAAGARRVPHHEDEHAGYAWAAAIGAVAVTFVGAAVVVGRVPSIAVLAAVAAAAWLTGAALDRSALRAPDLAYLGSVGRVGAVATLGLAAWPELALGPRPTAYLAAALSGAAVVDALRLRHPWPTSFLALTAPVMVATGSLAAGATLAQTGIALCLLAAVAAGVSFLVPKAWTWPLVALVVASGTAGLFLTRQDPRLLPAALIVLGSVGLAFAYVHRFVEGQVFAGLIVTLGIWGELAVNRIDAYDAYLAPVAVMLLAAGIKTAKSGTSSWIAYGPAIVVLGGAALVDRLSGGGGVHALVAGGVGIAAVLLGGSRRLAAPLLLGTALLLALTGYESLAVTRQVPTWGWLALGGSVLLAAGVVMERHATGPFDGGRRLVDVVHERFS